MNEKKIVIVALFIIFGVYLFGNLGITGEYVKGKQKCWYVQGPFHISQGRAVVAVDYDGDTVADDTFSNRCATLTAVTLVSCTDDVEFERGVQECPYGSICKDGICISGKVEKEDTECYDSDGYGNIYVRGETRRDYGSYVEKHVDVCADKLSVKEFACGGKKNKIVGYIEQCPLNYVCFNGACVKGS